MDARLEWWGNSSFMLGPFPVTVELTDEPHGRLRDPALLDELRDTHDLGSRFVLRLDDDSTVAVIVGRPDDDGRFTLTDVAAHRDAGTPGWDGGEPDDVARTTAWLLGHGFATTFASSSAGDGSRRFERADGWRVRTSAVLGVWTLELSAPGQRGFTGFDRARARHGDVDAAWHRGLPVLIERLSPRPEQADHPA